MNVERWMDEMGRRLGSKCRGWLGRTALQWVLVLASAWFAPAHAATEGKLDAGEAPKHHAQRHVSRQTLDDRVKMLSQALDLDAKQQAGLRKVLESQREQVRRVWADANVPAGYRIAETQAIGDRTADQIRSILNDEQKKKFNPPRPLHEAEDPAKRSVEDWMRAAEPK
jgi:hypothetical protein